jgi:hypothetical protein
MSSNVIKKDTARQALREIVRELVQEVLWEYEQQLPDPDEGLELSPEFAARLRKAMQERGKRNLHPADTVRDDLSED